MNFPGKKIVFISLTNGAGGAEQILQMCAKATNSEIIFLKELSAGTLQNDGSLKIRFLNKKAIFIGFILLIKELMSFRREYIIISSHSYLNAYLGILKRLGFVKAQIVSRECTSVFLRFSGFKRWTYKFVYRLGYGSIDLLVCQTSEMRNQLITNLTFLSEEKVIVLKNPLDVQYLDALSEATHPDQISTARYICSAGRLIKLKGFDLLISAFSDIADRHPELRLVILGEGEERPNLEAQIDQLGLQNRIQLKGFIQNPFPYFKHANLCVVSSIREGFPNVLLQMMALNSAVISTLCAEGIELFDSVRTIQPNDRVGLGKAIELELKDSKCSLNRNRVFLDDRTPKEFMNKILNSVT